MDKDQVIQSLSNMLQKRNNDIINLELQVAQLTTQLNANKEEEEKKDKKNEEQDIRTVQAKKSN